MALGITWITATLRQTCSKLDTSSLVWLVFGKSALGRLLKPPTPFARMNILRFNLVISTSFSFTSIFLRIMSGDSTYAAAPFDHAKADIILRSSDNINFRVFKVFLSLASPFFEALFDIPQPTQASKDQEIKDGLAVIPMTEDSKTLDVLLRFCYPCTLVELPTLEGFQDALNILLAAKKYSLDAIEKKACKAIMDPKILAVEPLRCFAIAHQGRMREEALLAAKYTLTRPLIPSWFQEIELLSTSELLALLTYHRKCGDAVYALRSNLLWVTSHYGSAESFLWLTGRTCSCACPRASIPIYTLWGYRAVQWWEAFMEETFIELRDKPCKATVQASADKTVQAVKAKNCYACSSSITEAMRDFVDVFASKIEEIVSQIELELKF